MKAVNKIAIGAVGLAALVGGAAPAAAQYYPGYPYGYGYQQNPANVIGQVLGQVLNPYGNRYAYGLNPQQAAQRCSAAVQQRLQLSYRAGYSPYGYSPYGYSSGYSSARVLGITRIEPRSSGVRVRGFATSGMGYGGYGGYGYGYGSYAAPADLSFRCDVDYRGYIRDIDIDRRR